MTLTLQERGEERQVLLVQQVMTLTLQERGQERQELVVQQVMTLTLQERGQERQELLVEQVVAAAPDGAEEAAQQQEVVVGLLGAQRQLHGPVHQLVQVGLQDRG